MRILVISQYYRPEEAFVATGVAEGLKERGHEVQVLTGYPNYPSGELFPGYSQKWRRFEEINGIKVCRVPLYVDHSQSAIRRAINYITFALSSATTWRFNREVEVIYVYATQMTPAFGPWIWKLFGGRPYLLHVQDLWPDSIIGSSLVASGPKAKWVEKALNPWLQSVYQGAARVIAIAPGMRNILLERGVDASKTCTIYNWSRNVCVPHPRDSEVGESERIVLYAGNVGDMQDLETAVRAAHKLKDRGLKLKILGTGVALQQIQNLCDNLSTSNIDFLESVSPEAMPELYASADYSLVTLKDLPAFEGTIPSKFQSSLANGLPVITTVRGDVRYLTEKFQIGFTADPEDVDSLVEAFTKALDQTSEDRNLMALRAFETYTNEFSFEAAISALEMNLEMAIKIGKKENN